MIKTVVGTESMTLTDFRIRRWFQSIADAENLGWHLVSAKLIPGWFVDYYTAQLHRNAGLNLEFTVGPVEDRLPSRGGVSSVPLLEIDRWR